MDFAVVAAKIMRYVMCMNMLIFLELVCVWLFVKAACNS